MDEGSKIIVHWLPPSSAISFGSLVLFASAPIHLSTLYIAQTDLQVYIQRDVDNFCGLINRCYITDI